MTYRLSDAAEADLDGILDYTWTRYGADQAKRYYLDLRETMTLLADTPLIARERHDLKPPVRVHPHGRHLIVYQALGTHILIVRVLHQQMDIESQL
jgi:toxin ParE1/3/4